MRVIAALLVIGVFLRHNSAKWLAGDFTPQAIFYMLGGVWEAILCATVLVFTAAMRPSIWRFVMQAAMVIGILEAVQMPVCRLMISDIRAVPPGMSLCDFVAGFPIGISIVAVYFLVIVWSIGRHVRAA